MWISIIILITWIAYSILSGLTDGYYYHYKNTSTQQKYENLHIVYVYVRAVVWLSQSLFLFIYYPTIASILFSICTPLIFSWFHNGMYYETRKKLSDGDIYPDGWWSNSTTSKAFLEFNSTVRTVMVVIGFAGIIMSYIINI